MRIDIENLSFAYNDSTPILKNINMAALPGEITALLGPNGSGKSTLLKCIAGILKSHGSISLNNKNLHNFKEKEIFSLMSYLPQENTSRAVLTVFEAVLLGRVASLSFRINREDLDIALKALEDVGIAELAQRYLNEISGGQKQMVSIAQAMVRETRVLLLDEPVSNLDLHYEMEILEWIKEISKKRNIATIITLHSLNLVARYADKAVILKDGHVFASGEPKAVCTPDVIREVYAINCSVKTEDGVLQITPLSSIRKGDAANRPGETAATAL